MEPPPTETVTPSSADAPIAAEQQLGRYRLLELFGEGGMATVWRAEHSEGGFTRDVAVKCLKVGLATPELRARFLREQQIPSAGAPPTGETVIPLEAPRTGRSSPHAPRARSKPRAR